ncbi:hypothetical protein [Streptomyces sp. LS1784]|uniref:hypothetical protein n=1 Tax=Streptomyces sp. LS1784 TaxID=2851533 RepID=UPI001CCF6D21|nr:hypothetical protein [Streptomyces sp. LS1784]
MRGCIARKIATLGLATVAALSALGTTAQPAAAAATIQDQTVTPGTAAASNTIAAEAYRCAITANYGWHWEGYCYVYSGQLRTITYCADGSHTTGLWIGARPQAWSVWGKCPGSTWTKIVFQWRS